MMKKILVTGSNGLLGQKIIYDLLQNLTFSGSIISPEIIAASLGANRLSVAKGYIYQPLDISDEMQVRYVFRKYRPDIIINTAAMTNVDACETEKDKCVAINLKAVEYMINTLEEMKSGDYDPHFIHLSTDFVFDGEAGPYKEDDIPNPLGFYSKSKYNSELVVKASRLRWTIIRTIILYGIVDGMSRTNVVLWAKQNLEQHKTINVVDDQFRTPTLAEDLAHGCLLAALKGATGIYHISGKDFMSILELVYRVADFYKLNKSFINSIKTNSLGQPAKRPPKTGFILEKATRDLGYQPHSFEDGLEILRKQLSKP